MTPTQKLVGMPIAERVQRHNVVREAIEWIGTPYISEARVKGVGADCAELLIGVFTNVGLIEPFRKDHLPRQWHLHATEEQYINRIVGYLPEIPGPPLPGDVALFHVKHAYAHAGIVVDWPHKIVHCNHRGGVQWGDAGRDAFLIMEQRAFAPRFFSYWAERAYSGKRIEVERTL